MQYKSLQAGRGIAALMVVVSHIPVVLRNHAGGFENQGWDLGYLRLWTSGGALGVEFFFVLSGVVILLAHQRDVGRPVALRTYLLKRVRRIYPIYWIIGTLSVLVSLRLGTQHDPDLLAPYTLVSNVVLVHLRSLHNDLFVAWTLFHEILFYGVFGLSILHAAFGWSAFALWIGGSAWMLVHPGGEWFVSYLLSPLHILFAWGCLIVWIVKRRRVPAPKVCVAVGLVLFLYAFYLCGPYTEFNVWVQQLAGIGVSLTLAGIMEIERSRSMPISSRLTFLGDASYSIYLVHLLSLNVFLRLLMPLSRHMHLPLIGAMAFLFICATVTGCCVHVAVERPLLRWLSRRVKTDGPLSTAT